MRWCTIGIVPDSAYPYLTPSRSILAIWCVCRADAKDANPELLPGMNTRALRSTESFRQVACKRGSGGHISGVRRRRQTNQMRVVANSGESRILAGARGTSSRKTSWTSSSNVSRIRPCGRTFEPRSIGSSSAAASGLCNGHRSLKAWIAPCRCGVVRACARRQAAANARSHTCEVVLDPAERPSPTQRQGGRCGAPQR